MDFGLLKIIPFNQIIPDFDSRGRKIYQGIEDLAISIKNSGLINPITVYSPDGQQPYKLLAGGRRYKACEHLRLTEVSVRIYNKLLSEDEFKAIELYENTKRQDLHFSEQVAMTNELNSLFTKMYGEKTARSVDAPGHSKSETARILGRSQASVSQDIKLSKAIKDFPELQLGSAKNKASAMHTLRRMQGMVTTQANIAVNKQLNPNQISLKDSYRVEDFFVGLQDLQKESFQFLEVDPPYGIDLQMMRSAEDKVVLNESYQEVDAVDYPSFIQKICVECYSLAATNSWIVFWCGPTWLNLIVSQLKFAGFTTNDVPGIWKKGNSPGQSLAPQTGLGNAYEMFVYARKGSPQLRIMGRSNIFDFNPIFPLHKWHPTQRPIELILELINTFCWPNSNILVPFLGSGQTLIAANRLGHKCVGFDLSQEFKNNFLSHVIGA